MSNSNKHWEKWGARDPYFAVLTDDAFRREALDKNRDDFFSSGERQISEILDQAERLFGFSFHSGRALEFGCGVGRLTVPLARRFQRLVGVDVSPSMLNEAAKNCAKLGINNVDLVRIEDTFDALSGPFDAIISYNVLQHIPSTRGYKIIDNLLSMASPGAFVMLHICLRRPLTPMRRAIGLIKDRVPFSGYFSNVLKGRSPTAPLMQMNEYDFPTVLGIFGKHRMTDVIVILDMHAEVMTAKLSGQKPTL